MAKLTLSNLSNESVPSSSATINANNDAIETALENTLSRDGTTPNQMEANLDMNSNRILNLAAVTSEDTTQPVRVGDLASLVAELGVQGPPGPAGDGTGDVLAANNGSDFTDAATFRDNLGLEYGVDILAYDADLQAIADLTWGNNQLIWKNGSGTVATLTAPSEVSDFLGAADVAAARTAIGLGDSAVADIGTGASDVASGDDSRFKQFDVDDITTNITFANSNLTKLLRHNSAQTHSWTIPADITTDFPIGSTFHLRNIDGGGTVTLTRASNVQLRIAGDSTNKNVQMAQNGVATLVKEAANTWFVVGAGLS